MFAVPIPSLSRRVGSPSSCFPHRRLRFAGGQSHRPLLQTFATTSDMGGKPEEVEVKLRLPDAQTHQKLLSILSPYHVTTHVQENFFLDSPMYALSAARAALRLRFYGGDRRCVLTLKSQPTFSEGISRAEEVEIEVDPYVGRIWAEQPCKLGRCGPMFNWVLERAREIVGVESGVMLDGWVCLGRFKNVRNVFDYQQLRLEVDETLFEFGTSYEVECESENPEEAKRVIEKLLSENGIGFSYSQESKFAVFKSGKLPA